MGTLKIEVTPELESRLNDEAAKHGLATPEFARMLLERQVMPRNSRKRSPVSPEERAARVAAVVGKYRHVPGSVDDFLKRKQEEIDLEEERWERWQQGRQP